MKEVHHQFMLTSDSLGHTVTDNGKVCLRVIAPTASKSKKEHVVAKAKGHVHASSTPLSFMLSSHAACKPCVDSTSLSLYVKGAHRSTH